MLKENKDLAFKESSGHVGVQVGTVILNVVVQNIELITSDRNDELINLFNWFFMANILYNLCIMMEKSFFRFDIFILTMPAHVSLQLNSEKKKRIVFGKCD